eukprot:TRINITY_DN32150_c0_g1_i1.p1 TRINITY_DN32150_c0_g1~~TRINITY_DN32150_c0_g1_i1.p1  ORF type:complete len:195 (+),score=72.44 TRINITY_DN32150_c0_g1_i1:42-626(+)
MEDERRAVEARIAEVQMEIDALDGGAAGLTEEEAAWSDRQVAAEVEKLKNAMTAQTRLLQQRDETLLVLLQRSGTAPGGVLGDARGDAVVLANLRSELAGYSAECGALDARKVELEAKLAKAHEALLSGIDAGFEKDVKLHFTKKSLEKIHRNASPSPVRGATVTPPLGGYRYAPSASPHIATSQSPPGPQYIQ